MSAPKFTPGPWEHHIGDDYVRVFKEGMHTDEEICEYRGYSKSDPQVRANALLISAAPDLFSAIFNSDDAHWTPAMRAAMCKAVGQERG